jgi:hypothetical protein
MAMVMYLGNVACGVSKDIVVNIRELDAKVRILRRRPG